MTLSLSTLEGLAFRLTLLLGLGLLLGCAGVDRAGTIASSTGVDAGDSIDVHPTIDSSHTMLDTQVGTAVDTSDVKASVVDTNAVEVLPHAVDTQLAIDGLQCLQQFIANHYASVSATCADVVPSAKASAGRTTEEACHTTVDCLLVNNCTYFMGGSDTCAACGNSVWDRMVPSWFRDLLIPYCGEGYFNPFR